MQYDYKKKDIDTYISSLYRDGFLKSKKYSHEKIKAQITNIGIFKFKGYVKAFRSDVSSYSIDNILDLYNSDTAVSLNMFSISSKVEVRLKAIIIDSAYELTDNPFFYLLKGSYDGDFTIGDESVYDWEIKEHRPRKKSEIYLHYRDYYLSKYDFEANKVTYLSKQELIPLNEKLNINYPPFHYFVENITLGALIKMISHIQIDGNFFLKIIANKFNIYDPNVFLSYLLRLKELRNRCAHNGRIFNRNYRGVKAFGCHREFRKTIYEHKLIDVYYSLLLLLCNTKFKNVEELKRHFTKEIFSNCDKKSQEFMMKVLETR